jgi:DNA-binding transcriptional LysR family regulator
MGCHNDSHTRNYRDSPHFALWQAEIAGEVPAGRGVSCATCHLPRESHKAAKGTRVLVQHNQNLNLRPDAASDDDLVFEVLVKDVLTPAVRSDHPLVRRRDLDLGDLVNREWVVFGRSGESRDVYEQTFRRNGFAPPKSTIDCTSFTCALALVEKSDYLVLAPRQIFAERRRTWTIAPLTLRTPMQPWTIAAITRAGDIPSPACREFLRQLRAVMPG